MAKASGASVDPVLADETVSPTDSAGPIGWLLFDYVRPLLRKGAKNPLMFADLPPTARRDRAALVTGLIEEAWQKELLPERAKNSSCCFKGPSLLRALGAAFFKDHLAGCILSIIEEATIVGQLVMIRPLLRIITLGGSGSDAWALAGGLSACSLAQAISHHQNFLWNMRCGWNLRIGMIGVLHSKLLRLNTTSLRDTQGGSVYNLIASDVMRFDSIMPFLHFSYNSVVVFLLLCGLMVIEVGWAPTAAGGSTMVVLIMIQLYFSRQFARRRGITAKITDQRVRLTNEVKAHPGRIFSSLCLPFPSLSLRCAAPSLGRSLYICRQIVPHSSPLASACAGSRRHHEREDLRVGAELSRTSRFASGPRA